MPAKRAMEYRTKLLYLPDCKGADGGAPSLVKANKLLEEAVNDRALLDAGWELHDVVGLTRSQKRVHVTADPGDGFGPIFVLVVFRRNRRKGSSYTDGPSS
jgi:hypothetical protein